MENMSTYFWVIDHIPVFQNAIEMVQAAMRNCNYRASKGLCHRQCDHCNKATQLADAADYMGWSQAEITSAMDVFNGLIND